MWTTANIRRQLARMTGNKPFSIREFLAHGARPAVDQAFARLVNSGEVIRVARGLYIKCNSPHPSVLDVALAKAAAFKRTIAIHGSQAAADLKISEKSGSEYVFATSGRSSSFRFGKHCVRFIGTAARKLHLGNTRPGLAIRALWHLGRRFCTMETASCAVASFNRSDREQFKQHPDLLPAWMQEHFLSIKRYWEERQRLEFSRNCLS